MARPSGSSPNTHDIEGEALFGSAFYYTTVFGAPEDVNWAWMVTGHHMSAMFTVAGERTSTPIHRAATVAMDTVITIQVVADYTEAQVQPALQRA
jgi:hypothetical protein